MEALINQAFAHIDDLGPHVRAGHYELEGPEGEQILKNIWDTTVQPGWQVTMKMWPQLENHPTRRSMPPPPAGLSPQAQQQWMRQRIIEENMRRGHAARPVSGHMHMPPMNRGAPPPPPGAHFPTHGPPGGHPGPAPGIRIVPGGNPGKEKSKKETKKKVASWMIGKPSKSSSKRSVPFPAYRSRYE